MIRILVDSSSDITREEAIENNYAFIPLQVNIQEREYVDGVDLQRDHFYGLLTSSKTFPKTSQPTPQAFVKEFEKAKEQGDELICILLSSDVSGTYQSACLAKDIVDYDKIYLIDSRSATGGVILLVNEADKMIKEGKSATQIMDRLEELKDHIKIYFSVDTLEYLYRGGRLNKTGYVIGGIAKVKPILEIQDGKIHVAKKVIGSKKVLNTITEMMVSDGVDMNYPVYTQYSYGNKNIEKLEEKIKEHVSIERRVQIGPAIGSHVGPEAFAVVFIEK